MKKLSNNSGGYAGVLIVLLIGVIAVLGYLYFNKDSLFFKKFTQTTSVTTVNNSSIPGFPDFPLYPNSKVITAQYTSSLVNTYYRAPSFQIYLRAEATEEVSEIITWYKNTLIPSGWSLVEDADSTDPQDQSIQVSNKDMLATVNVEKYYEEIIISINIQLGVTDNKK